MNYVTVWGQDDQKKRLVEDVAFFCIDELMPRMETLDICIDMCDDDMETADGYCMSVDKRKFEILIDPRLEGDDLITAVCHEMVHVKQYARGEITAEAELLPYFDRPFEKEAYDMQEKLLAKYNS